MEQLTCQVLVIRSRRKTVGIQISKPGEVIIRAPLAFPDSEIHAILEARRPWIEKHLAKIAERTAQAMSQPPLTREEIDRLADAALHFIPSRVQFFAARIGVSYGRITIRNQRTRWGSCSSKGNLNFNCLLMLCPPEVIDYVVVHELCHRKEMNHSSRFWAEVSAICPDYRRNEKWLKQHGREILARMDP